MDFEWEVSSIMAFAWVSIGGVSMAFLLTRNVSKKFSDKWFWSYWVFFGLSWVAFPGGYDEYRAVVLQERIPDAVGSIVGFHFIYLGVSYLFAFMLTALARFHKAVDRVD